MEPNNPNPNLHHKPTKEELEANMAKSLEELDKLDAAPPVETPEETPPAPVDDTKSEDEDDGVDEEVEVAPPTETVPAKEEDKTHDQDLDRHLKASTDEAKRLYRNNVEMNKAIEEGNLLPDPTVDELMAEYPEWEDMDPLSQRFAKEAFISKRFRMTIEKANAQQREIDKWEDTVVNFVNNPTTLNHNPDLEGKQQKFIEFCQGRDRVGVGFDLLVPAFLHHLSEEKSKQPSKKGQKMFETGSGGPNDNPQPKIEKLTLAEADMLRKTDYKKFREYLIAGKIEAVG